MPQEKSQAYREAEARVNAKLGFYRHLASFVLVIGLLAIINLLTSPDQLWFFWPALGWGIAITLHGLSVFNIRSLDRHKEKMIQREMEKMDQ